MNYNTEKNNMSLLICNRFTTSQIFICIEDRFRDNDLSFIRDVKPHHEKNIRYKFEKSFLCALIQYLNAKTKVCKYGAARYSFSVNFLPPF